MEANKKKYQKYWNPWIGTCPKIVEGRDKKHSILLPTLILQEYYFPFCQLFQLIRVSEGLLLVLMKMQNCPLQIGLLT